MNSKQPWWENTPEAREVKAMNFTPLEPYPGRANCKWRMRHEACGQEVATSLKLLRSTVHSGCVACRQAKIAETNRLRAKPSEKLRARLKELNLSPLEPYPGTKAPWRMRHLACGREVTPRAHNLASGRSSGCVMCAQEKRRA